MGLRGRTSTFLIRITDDDNDKLSSYATKDGSIIDVNLTNNNPIAHQVIKRISSRDSDVRHFRKSVKTIQLNPANHGRESSSRKTSGPANASNLRRKLAMKLTYTVLEVRIMRQKEELQEKKRKPSHRVKRDMSFANRERIL
ncbi:hypothetical protein Tco_0079526 [Tanacetum coccineum]